MPTNMSIVYYDQDCFLCRQLAAYAGKNTQGEIEFRPCSENKGSSCDRLVVQDQSVIYEGVQAWEWLLQKHPTLQNLGWLAQKLNFEKEIASGLESVGTRLRRLCYRCRG